MSKCSGRPLPFDFFLGIFPFCHIYAESYTSDDLTVQVLYILGIPKDNAF